MKQTISTANTGNIILEFPITDRVQEGKDRNKVRFTGAIRADQHVDGPEFQLLDISDAFETLNCDGIEYGYGSYLDLRKRSFAVRAVNQD